MSFNLGNWANQLTCDMCNSDLPLDLNLPENYLDKDLPPDFWDPPAEPAPEKGFQLPSFPVTPHVFHNSPPGESYGPPYYGGQSEEIPWDIP